MKWLLLPLVLVFCASARTESAALTLTMEGGTCSGTAVGPNVVLTAAHCWQAGRLVAINGEPTFALEKIEDGQDHALVRVNRTFKAYASRFGTAKRGDDVTWGGSPQGVVGVIRRGYVAKVENDGELLLDAHATGGDSGSGIFNNRGELVGVLSGGYSWKHGMAVFTLIYCKPLKFTARDWKEIRE